MGGGRGQPYTKSLPGVGGISRLLLLTVLVRFQSYPGAALPLSICSRLFRDDVGGGAAMMSSVDMAVAGVVDSGVSTTSLGWEAGGLVNAEAREGSVVGTRVDEVDGPSDFSFRPDSRSDL